MKRLLISLAVTAAYLPSAYANVSCGPVSENQVTASWGALNVSRQSGPSFTGKNGYVLTTTVGWLSPGSTKWYNESRGTTRHDAFTGRIYSGVPIPDARMEMAISFAGGYTPDGSVNYTTLPGSYVRATANGFVVGADGVGLKEGDVHWSQFLLYGPGSMFPKVPWTPVDITFTRLKAYPADSATNLPCSEAASSVNALSYSQFGPYTGISAGPTIINGLVLNSVFDCLAWAVDGSLTPLLPENTTLGGPAGLAVPTYNPPGVDTTNPWYNKGPQPKAVPVGAAKMLLMARNLYVRQGVKGQQYLPGRRWGTCSLS